MEEAVDGSIALVMMREKQYDVVLMDLQMPIMGGIEAVGLFRQEEEKLFRAGSRSTRQLIIGMSACGDRETQDRAEEVGMDAFLSKPFSLAGMLNIVSTS